jgi:2-polyprenyl-3-methyl-5-hydroxy-6-metoxy-1,4-benzoquinol methylase
MSAMPPLSTKVLQRRDWSRRANNRHSQAVVPITFTYIEAYRTGVEDDIGGAQMNGDAAGRKARAKTQFNTVAAEYDAGPGCFAHFGRRLVTAAEIQPGQRVLDVASGRGAVLFPCAEQVGQTGEVVGVDLADEMVRATNAEASSEATSARPNTGVLRGAAALPCGHGGLRDISLLGFREPGTSWRYPNRSL